MEMDVLKPLRLDWSEGRSSLCPSQCTQEGTWDVACPWFAPDCLEQCSLALSKVALCFFRCIRVYGVVACSQLLHEWLVRRRWLINLPLCWDHECSNRSSCQCRRQRWKSDIFEAFG
eukprot:930196-Amphidinium_carterae.1